MALRHVGKRPTYELRVLNWKKHIYYEEYPDGTIILWNKKTLLTGCGHKIHGMIRELMECIYCPTCKEYFHVTYWEEE